MTTPLHILAITPGTGFQPQVWARVLGSGVDAFMIREPSLEAGALLEAARWCGAQFPEVRLWVNGRLDVALAVGCGLHAPEAYPRVPEGLVPLSQPLHAEAQGERRRSADQLLVSPIYAVPGKGEAWGPLRLHAWLDTLPPGGPRLLALGGINEAEIPALRHPRLAGVALIRALWEAPDPQTVVTQLRAAWQT